MVTSQSENENTVYFRTVSCPCAECMVGSLGNCSNFPFVSAWETCTIGFKAVPQGLTAARNIQNVRAKLQVLHRQRPALPWFCCLGWVANQQQPAVLLLTDGWFQPRVNQQNVKCHLLVSPAQIRNDFTNTVVQKPALCNRLEGTCNCTDQHAINFPLAHILEVAVVKGANNLQKSLFCKFTPTNQNRITDAIHLSMSKESVLCFAKYSEKRLKFFNDFILLPNNV